MTGYVSYPVQDFFHQRDRSFPVKLDLFCRRQYEHDASLAHRGAVISVTRSVTICFHGTNNGDAK